MATSTAAPCHRAALADLLPNELARDGIAVRQQNEADMDFIRDLYVANRWAEVAAAPGWTDAMRRAFLCDQARLQWLHYSKYYADAQFLIIESKGERIGRLYLSYQVPDDVRIVEISFLPHCTGHGLGTRFLMQVQKIAVGLGRSCSLHVERHNRARLLYLRYGFIDSKLEVSHYLMVWQPPSPYPPPAIPSPDSAVVRARNH